MSSVGKYNCRRTDFNGGHQYHHDKEDPHAAHTSSPASKTHLPTLGLEWYGALGDTRRMDFDPSRQEHYLQPVLMLHLNKEIMFHLGVAIGLSNVSDDMVRTGLAIEF